MARSGSGWLWRRQFFLAFWVSAARGKREALIPYQSLWFRAWNRAWSWHGLRVNIGASKGKPTCTEFDTRADSYMTRKGLVQEIITTYYNV
jgi:hypothetical protein